MMALRALLSTTTTRLGLSSQFLQSDSFQIHDLLSEVSFMGSVMARITFLCRVAAYA